MFWFFFLFVFSFLPFSWSNPCVWWRQCCWHLCVDVSVLVYWSTECFVGMLSEVFRVRSVGVVWSIGILWVWCLHVVCGPFPILVGIGLSLMIPDHKSYKTFEKSQKQVGGVVCVTKKKPQKPKTVWCSFQKKSSKPQTWYVVLVSWMCMWIWKNNPNKYPSEKLILLYVILSKNTQSSISTTIWTNKYKWWCYVMRKKTQKQPSVWRWWYEKIVKSGDHRVKSEYCGVMRVMMLWWWCGMSPMSSLEFHWWLVWCHVSSAASSHVHGCVSECVVSCEWFLWLLWCLCWCCYVL